MALDLWREFAGDRWIPRTKGQERGNCFHLMTSSWFKPFPLLLLQRFLRHFGDNSLVRLAATWRICCHDLKYPPENVSIWNGLWQQKTGSHLGSWVLTPFHRIRWWRHHGQWFQLFFITIIFIINYDNQIMTIFYVYQRHLDKINWRRCGLKWH